MEVLIETPNLTVMLSTMMSSATQKGTIPETNVTVPQAEFECRSLKGGSPLLSLDSHVFLCLVFPPGSNAGDGLGNAHTASTFSSF